MNPALLDQPYVTMPLLFGNLNVGTTGNAGAANFIYKMQPSWQGYGNGGRELTTFMHPNVDRNEFLDGLKERNNFGVYLKYQILGVAFKAFGGINSVDLSLRSNTNVCLPKDLFAFMKETGAQEEYDISTIGVNSQSYMELGLGHARQINDRLRVGAKVKLLFGLGYGYYKATDFHVKMNENQWIVNGKAELSLSPFGSQFKYKKDKNYVDPETGQVTDRQRVDGLTDDFKANLAGMGMAVDLGATYKLLPTSRSAQRLQTSASSAGAMRFTPLRRANGRSTALRTTSTWTATPTRVTTRLRTSWKTSATTLRTSSHSTTTGRRRVPRCLPPRSTWVLNIRSPLTANCVSVFSTRAA